MASKSIPARRGARKLTSAAVAWWFAVFALVIGISWLKGDHNVHTYGTEAGAVASASASRQLLSTGGAADWNPVHTESGYVGPLGWPGVFVWVLMTIWIFSGVAIAADEYFQPALEAISDTLGLSADVRGATFLAAASSAPEFFTSFADTFLVSDQGGAGFGVGTIVGSAVFNVLIIVALSTIPTLGAEKEHKKNKPEEPERTEEMTDEQYELALKKYKGRLTSWENKLDKLQKEGCYLPIDWYPLCRDTVFYALSIIIMATTVSTHKPLRVDRKPNVTEGCVHWYESMIYIILYVLYIFYMYKSADFRPAMEKVAEAVLNCCPCCRVEKKDEDNQPEKVPATTQGPLDPEAMVTELKAKEELEEKAESEAPSDSDDDSDDDEEGGLLDNIMGFDDEWNSPFGIFCNCMGIFAMPFKLLFSLTIPNVSRKAMQGSNFVTVLSFVMCILWIGFLSAMMVKTVSWIGAIVKLHPVVMGLVVLAAGTSVPDALGSYNEAKHGNADAAVSNALGSNVFDICVGLGVPWFIFALAKGRCFSVPAEEILIPTIILFAVLFMFLGTLAFYKMRLFGKVGFVYLIVYAIVVAWFLVNGIKINFKL